MAAPAQGGMASRQRIAVVIVTFRSAEVIEGCLAALPDALDGVDPVAVVVADNASSDDTVERALRVRPDTTIVQTGANLGYAAAINAGARAVPDYDYLLILNPDTVVTAGFVPRLVDALAGHQDRGIAVPRFMSMAGETSRSLRREPTLLTAAGETLLGGRRAGRLGVGELVGDPARYTRPGPVDWATGAALLVSRSCADAVGDWDESFLLYSEETDFMLRARDAGFTTWYVPDAVVMHRGGESSTSPFLWSLMMANKYRLHRRRHGRLQGTVFRFLLLVGEWGRGLTGNPRARAAAKLLARPDLIPDHLPG